MRGEVFTGGKKLIGSKEKEGKLRGWRYYAKMATGCYLNDWFDQLIRPTPSTELDFEAKFGFSWKVFLD